MPIYWAFLTYMLLRPTKERENKLILFEGMDKGGHLFVFVLLGFLFRGTFQRQKFWVFISIMFLYALLTEILQYVMKLGRSFELLDLFADLLGVIIGFLLFDKGIKSYWNRKNNT